MENQNLGRVVDLVETRPVCMGTEGRLVAGDSSSFLDLLLRNAKGEEKLIRVPVPESVVDFYATGMPVGAQLTNAHRFASE